MSLLNIGINLIAGYAYSTLTDKGCDPDNVQFAVELAANTAHRVVDNKCNYSYDYNHSFKVKKKKKKKVRKSKDVAIRLDESIYFRG